MKKFLLYTIMFLNIGMVATSCNSNSIGDEKEEYKFYYYPEKNVYYDVEKKHFLYSIDGGKTWDSIRNTSGNNPGTLGEKVVINSIAREVYESNEAHRNLYKGRLYNIVGRDTAVSSSVPEATERKVVQKSKTETKPKLEEEKPKKGLKKFLNKIFGKHDKKQEQ